MPFRPALLCALGSEPAAAEEAERAVEDAPAGSEAGGGEVTERAAGVVPDEEDGADGPDRAALVAGCEGGGVGWPVCS